MTAIGWGLMAFSIIGGLAGALGGFVYCRRKLRDKRVELGQVLIERSDSLRRIDMLAGALHRAQHAKQVLAECDGSDWRAEGAAAEAARLDRDLQRETAHFLVLNRCAERKGAATAVLRPPEAERLVSRARVA
jgi:hypothetical protein